MRSSDNNRLVILFGLLAFLPSYLIGASSLSVEPKAVEVGDTVEIVVTLQDEFASLDSVTPPVRGLRIDGGPSVSSQFQWINGETTRRKTFQFTAEAVAPGIATVGPILLRDRSGKTMLLPQVTVEVRASAPAPAGSSSAESLASQELVFILPELDRPTATVGQEVGLTWYLYTSVSVRDLRLASKPAFDDFWSEEIPIDQSAVSSTVALAGRAYRRIPIRSVALFPLHAGALTIGSLDVILQVVKPDNDPFSISFFGGQVVSARRKSPPLSLNVEAIPPGEPVQAVGSFVLSCGRPIAGSTGPVAVDVSVGGYGNLRGASAPQFDGTIEGTVTTEDDGVTVRRDARGVSMIHRWKLLLFPKRKGPMEVPAVTFRTFDPSSGSRQLLRCGGGSVMVTAAQTPAPAAGSSTPKPPLTERDNREWIRRAAGTALILLLVLALGVAIVTVLPRWKRPSRVTADPVIVEELIAPAEHARELRQRLARIVFERGFSAEALEREPTPLGEAYRSVSSWIEAEGRSVVGGPVSPPELRRRAERLALELERARPGFRR